MKKAMETLTKTYFNWKKKINPFIKEALQKIRKIRISRKDAHKLIKQYFEKIRKIKFSWKSKYTKIFGVLILFILAYKYFAPFGAQVNYQLTSDNNQVEKIKGLESVDQFKKDANVLLKIPQQIIQKNIVTFSVKPLYKNIDKVGVFLRFKGNPKEIKIGIRGSQKQKYVYKSFYNVLLNPLSFKTSGEISFWQKKQNFKNYSDFSKNIPTTNLIGYYMLDSTQLSINSEDLNSGQNSSTVIDKTLRGSHIFYVKVTQSPFVLKVDKQDANLYAGEDRLLVTVEKNNQVLSQKEIADDGVTNNSRLQISPQSEEVKIDNAETGVYKVTLKDESQGADVRIKRIEVNQQGLIFASPIFIVDANPTTLMTDAKNISFRTAHSESFQTVKIDNQNLSINKVNMLFASKPMITTGLHMIAMSKSDLTVSGDGYFAFDKNSYFTLAQSNFVDINTIKSTDSVDYIVANYHPAMKKGDWYEAFVTFSSQDFKLEGDLLYFSLESPDLATYGGEINVDSLDVSVRKP